jgi:hypothetical protein
MFKELKAYKKSNGWVLHQDDEPLLQWWANSQRYMKRKRRLSEERIAELDSISFPWNNYEIDYYREHYKRGSKRKQSLGRKNPIGTRIKRVSFSTQKVSLLRCPEIHHVLFQCRLSRVTNRSWVKVIGHDNGLNQVKYSDRNEEEVVDSDLESVAFFDLRSTYNIKSVSHTL